MLRSGWSRPHWQERSVGILSLTRNDGEPYFRPFFDAAWYLCRIGETAPASEIRGPGFNGDGYSITSFGREWLASSAQRPPSDPSRFVQIIRPLATRFGRGFSNVQRRRQLATGPEIILPAARLRARPSQFCWRSRLQRWGRRVVAEYRSGGGRAKIIRRTLGNVAKPLSDQFTSAASLVTYWRNETAHGTHTTINEAQVCMSLGELLRFAHFASDHWARLTA
jgi:hypothetical protein